MLNSRMAHVRRCKEADYCSISNEMKLQSKMIVREMILNEMKVFLFIMYLSDQQMQTDFKLIGTLAAVAAVEMYY